MSDANAQPNTVPLPLSLPSLEYVPENLRGHFARGLSGAFELVSIPADDHVSFRAYLTEITSGRLMVLPAGTTAGSLAKAAQAEAARQNEVLVELDRLTAKAVADRQAAFDARAAAIIKTNAARRRAGLDPLPL